MNRSLMLAALIAIISCPSRTLCQNETPSIDQSSLLILERSATPAKTVFVVPPSYLAKLKSGASPATVASPPQVYTLNQSPSARLLERVTTQPSSERVNTYRSAPPVVYVNQFMSPASRERVVKAPVLQGFTSKNGKLKLRDFSANEPAGLNNKWLELQERDLIERSSFEPPGGVPRASTY
jgi:hypothetical protein